MKASMLHEYLKVPFTFLNILQMLLLCCSSLTHSLEGNFTVYIVYKQHVSDFTNSALF